MTDETRAKIAATNAAQQALFDSQVIKIDSDWTIRRADELNWEVQYRGRFHGFYSHLATAFRALLGKMTDLEAQSSLNDAIECTKRHAETIERALFDAKKLVKSMNP